MKSKQKILVALASFTVCSVAFAAAVVYPVFRGVLEDYEKVLAHKRAILQLKEDANSTREFETLSDQYEKEFARLEGFFVDSETPIAFFRFLDETAARFSVQIEKSPGSIEQSRGDLWPSFEIRLAGSGAYPNVMAFLRKIENSSYLLEIQTLAISTEKGFGHKVEFSLSLKVFTKPL